MTFRPEEWVHRSTFGTLDQRRRAAKRIANAAWLDGFGCCYEHEFEAAVRSEAISDANAMDSVRHWGDSQRAIREQYENDLQEIGYPHLDKVGKGRRSLAGCKISF